MSEFPSGWIESHSIDLAEPIRGVTYKKEQSCGIPTPGFTAVLRANNIQKDKIDLSDLVYVPDGCISEKQRLRRNDIVIAMSSGSASLVGKSAQIFDEIDASFGAFCGTLRPSDHIEARYLGHFLKSDTYRSGISELSRGVNINNLKWSHFEEIELPLAPLPEQKRIADKLDSLLARIDACRDRLDRLPTIIKQFRQSVLAAATSGRLTEEWCEKNLLADKWEERSLSNLTSKITDGEHITPKRSPNGKYLLSARNIQNGSIALENVDYVDDLEFDRIRRRCDPSIGDVLLSCSGSVGRAALVDRDNYYVMVRSAAMIRPQKQLLHPTYLLYCLQSPSLQAQIKKKSSATAQSNIFLGSIKELVLPIPGLPEQGEINRRVDQLFSLADRLEARVKTARARVDTLTPSTLAKAFRGELVPQDPNDEPASVLLERIRAEKGAANTMKNKKDIS